MTCLGLDIGGANLKAADGQGWARSVPFALWRHPDELAEELAALVASAPDADSLAVTMTGELCDCFESKPAGVRHILAAAAAAAEGRPLRVYLVDGRFVSTDEARLVPRLAAASNWHALASFACLLLKPGVGRAAMLVDIGSTTTDIVPLVDARVAARGSNDTERLACGELVYSGVGRTPVCAVTSEVLWRGKRCGLAAELFATMADVYLLLGEIEEDPAANWTADGRPLSLACSRQRLARMLCADAADLSHAEIKQLAASVAEVHIRQLSAAVESIIGGMTKAPSQLILCGAGEFLAGRLFGQSDNIHSVSLAEQWGPELSRCAPAHAVAVLARANLS